MYILIKEAEAYMTELSDFELDDIALKNIAGGECYMRTSLDDMM